MPKFSSPDGATIGYEIHGPGDAPLVIWVHGATAYRAFQNTALRVAELAELRILTYDRRGRGESTDVSPYSVQREIDDIGGLVEVLGGRVAALVGESSGAILALEAGLAGVATNSIVAYEPPFIIDDARPPLPSDYVDQLDAFTAAGDAESAHRMFLTAAVGLPGEFFDGIRHSPIWPLLEPVAPTIAYDGRIARDYMRGSAAPLQRFAELRVPVLVAVGDQTASFIRDGGRALVRALKHGRLELIAGGSHQTDPDLVSAPIGNFVRSVA